MNNPVLTLILCAIATAALTLTITKSSLFAPVRVFLVRRSKFFGGLVTCPFCCSHWVAFALVAYFQPRPVVTMYVIADLFLSAFAVVGFAPVFTWIIYQVYKGIKPPDEKKEEQSS